MRFVIFSHAPHYQENGKIYSYGPYVKEMNLWVSNFDEVVIVAPFSTQAPDAIDLPYEHSNISLEKIPNLHYKKHSLIKNLSDTLRILKTCRKVMKQADHIHLRCPGNVGMLAMLVSSLFPSKTKTVKYAGNWRPNSHQPLGYRFQKWWLSNTFFTRNAQVLVYGNRENESKNIFPFFTASFAEKDKIEIDKIFKPPFRFIFCGSLSESKQSLLAVKIIHQLKNKGFDVTLDIYGEGSEKQKLEQYLNQNNLIELVRLHGNQPQEVLKAAYQNSHFCLLPSKSEGWPKALAEGMFFGCIPIGTDISCVPWMLGNEKRGLLISVKENQAETSAQKVVALLEDEDKMLQISQAAQDWSRKYTLEKFKVEINKLL